MSMPIIQPVDVRVTTTMVKEHVLATAIRWMTMAGLLVQENRLGNVMTLKITIPPQSKDPHGDRARNAAQHASTT